MRDSINVPLFCYDARHEHTSFYCYHYGHPFWNMGMGGRLPGLLSWAGFLGCTAYFACPQGGFKGLLISACTLLSGMVWALVIIHGSALAPHLEIVSYVLTGIVAFLMCIRQSSYCFLLFREHLSAPARHLQGRVTGGWYYRRWRWG